MKLYNLSELNKLANHEGFKKDNMFISVKSLNEELITLCKDYESMGEDYDEISMHKIDTVKEIMRRCGCYKR